MKIISGLILTALGALMVARSEDLFRFFGRIAWFEKHLGAEGGSRLGYKIVGLIVIFLGLLTFSGTFNDFFTFALSPLIRE